MIKVEHLYKSFEDRDVLKDINATFRDGEVNLIIGQSGSGKTVLMKNIVGLLTPTQGSIYYDDRDFVALGKREKILLRREMGMIFQSAALARVNLQGAENKFPGEISGGMQKRVAIARAIVLQPKYLFCDEPNSGLDPKTSIVIDELIAGITHEDKITTIVNTHDMNSVMGIGENITFICEGRAEWQGSNKEIMDATNKRLEDFIFASDILRQAKELHDQQKHS